MDEELVVIENPKEGENDAFARQVHRTEDVRIAPLNEFFDLTDRKTSNKEQQQLTAIMDFLENDTDTKNDINVHIALRNIEEKLSSPKLGETRIGKIYNYVKTIDAIKLAEKDRDSQLR